MPVESLDQVYHAGDEQSFRESKKRRLPADERQRAVRACDHCRRLKEKCEGGIPCRRCTRFNRVCEFKTDPAKHVSSDEPTSNPSDKHLSARAKYMEQILLHLLPELDLNLDSLREKAESLTQTESRTEDVESEGDDALAIEDENYNINAVNDTVAHYSGEFSYWNFSERIKKHVKELMATNDASDAQDPTHVPHYWRVDELHPDSGEIADARSGFPPRQIAVFLVHVFFKHAATNYFYVDQTWLLQQMNSMYEGVTQLESKDAGSIAIVLAVFAIGSQYAHLESASSGQQSSSLVDEWDDQIGTMFYRSAAKLLPQIIHLASLESVQACLLFGLYALPIDASGLAYIYLNLAIKLAMQNGMHRRIPSQTYPPKMIEARNRVWWTAYCTEKKIGIFHGRPSSVSSLDIDVDQPSTTMEMESRNSSLTSHLPLVVTMMKHLDEFYTELIQLRRCQKAEVSAILSRLYAKKETFRSWWDTSAPRVLVERNQSQMGPSRADMHLQLEYCLIRMFVGRPLLLARSGAGTTPSVSSELGPGSHASNERTVGDETPRISRTAALVDDCVQAALKVIDICQSMRENGIGLAKSSYIEYSASRASLLVLIAYCIQNQTDKYHFPLSKGLEIIHELTAGDSARCEVLLIQALDRAVKRLHFFSAKQQDGQSQDAQPTVGYDSFKKWTSMLKNGSAVRKEVYAEQDLFSTTGDDVQRLQWPDTATQPDWHARTLSGITQDHDIHYDVFGTDTSGFGHLQSAAGSAFFGLESIDPTSALYMHPERQLMESFLAVPQRGPPIPDNYHTSQ